MLVVGDNHWTCSQSVRKLSVATPSVGGGGQPLDLSQSVKKLSVATPSVCGGGQPLDLQPVSGKVIRNAIH